jgi:ABC-2 type transport system permease protein
MEGRAMKHKLIGWKAVFVREVRRIKGDFNILAVILLAPLFYAFFYGSIYGLKGEQDVPVAVVDMDHSADSRQFIRNLDAHKLVKVFEQSPDYGQAIDLLMEMKVHAILLIPEEYSESIKLRRGAYVTLYLNTSRFLIANDINKAVNEVGERLGGNLRMQFFQQAGYSRDQALQLVDPLRLEQKALFNPLDSYGDFLIPGLLVLIIQQTMLIGLSESIAKEREKKTLLDLFRISGNSTWATMSGKGYFYLLLYVAYSFFFFVVHFRIFAIPFRGSVVTLGLVTGLFLLSVIYWSQFISSFFSKKIVSMQFFVFTSYPIFLLSGYSWPLQSMPVYLQVISNCIPSTPYLHAFIRITQMGASWTHIQNEVVHLFVIAVLGLLLSRLRLKYLIRQEMDTQTT